MCLYRTGCLSAPRRDNRVGLRRSAANIVLLFARTSDRGLRECRRGPKKAQSQYPANVPHGSTPSFPDHVILTTTERAADPSNDRSLIIRFIMRLALELFANPTHSTNGWLDCEQSSANGVRGVLSWFRAVRSFQLSKSKTEILMRRWIICAAAASLAAVWAGKQADAMPIDRLAHTAVPTGVEQVQFIFGGRNYCWYDDGWRGPGFYWCGYAWRRGLGWGGGMGWHGWGGPGRMHGIPGHGHIGRPGGGHPGHPGGGGPGHGGHHR